jgi:hypothetical protein
VISLGSGAKITKQGERVSITPLTNNGRWPEARPNFNGSKDPDGRLLFAADERAYLVRLQFVDLNPGGSSVIESTTRSSGLFQPAIHGVPGNLLDSGDGRFIHTLNTHNGELIEHCSANLEPVIDGAAGAAKGLAAGIASEATTSAPASLLETETNDDSQRWFCLERT